MGFRKGSGAAADTEVNDAPVLGDDDTRLNLHRVSDEAAAPTPAIPDPIFAQDNEGQHRPMSGGSFIRLEDGTLIRNPEA